MENYRAYFDTQLNLERKLIDTFSELNISPKHKNKLLEVLWLIKRNDKDTYKHSIRVALMCKKLGEYLNIDQKALFYAGLLHDAGKYKISNSLLTKKSFFNEDDKIKIREHVKHTHDLLKGHFDFSAEVSVWHHKFQKDPYPTETPALLHNYSEHTQELIKMYGKLVSIVDVYDAMHRDNARFNKKRPLTSEEIKTELLKAYPNDAELVTSLYDAKIFN